MTPMRTVRCAAAAAAVVAFAACSKDSTGPADPLVGAWHVTVQNLIYNGAVPPDTGTITPAPFTMTVGKSGQAYSITFPALTWNVTISGIASHIPIPPSDSVAYTATGAGDTLRVVVPWTVGGNTCQLQISGSVLATTAQGRLDVVGGTCGTLGGPEAATGSWTATKQ